MAQTLPRGRPFDRYDTPPWSLTAVGLVFAITGIVYLLTHPTSPGVWVVELALVSVPAAGIVYGGYWVATRQLRRIDQWSIVTQALVGGVVAGLLIAVYAQAEQAGGTAVADAELLVLLGTVSGTAVSLFSHFERTAPSPVGTVSLRRPAVPAHYTGAALCERTNRCGDPR
jgi:drug/metabolite transporter (DMT)-like permease